MTLPCPGGSIPKPGLTAATALLDLGLVGTDILDHIAKVWPGLISQTIWGRVDVATLCAQQAEDPGPPSPEDLAYTAILAAQAAGGALGGAYGSWALKEIYYQVFLNSCQCSDGITVPPPHQPVPPPSTQDLYPTDPGARDVITKILDNQQTSGDALTTLYLGLQRTATDVFDLRMREVQNVILNYGAPIATMTGEGNVALAPFVNSGGNSTQDTLGVFVSVDQLPTKFKQQGSLVPRYYGIGSVMYDATYPGNGEPVITRRHSLHYRSEFVEAPKLAQSFALHWRLMPGASARVWQLFRATDNAIYTYGGAYPDAFDRFDGIAMPPGWTDSPFFPKATREHHRSSWALRQCQPTPFDF